MPEPKGLPSTVPQSASGDYDWLEKRGESRYPCNDPAEVRSDRRNLPARLMDISQSGLCVEVTRPVRIGSKIEVTWQTEPRISGEVRNCRQYGEKFRVGILVQGRLAVAREKKPPRPPTHMIMA